MCPLYTVMLLCYFATRKNLKSEEGKKARKNGTLLKMASSLSTGTPKRDNAE